jgi:hypothetical protein
MTKAHARIRDGQPHAAYDALRKAQQFTRGGGLPDAMLAYSCIGVGDSDGAKNACKRVLDRNDSSTDDRRYIEQYCRYLLAVLANNYPDYVEERQKLKSMPCSETVGNALRADRLFVPDQSSTSIN